MFLLFYLYGYKKITILYLCIKKKNKLRYKEYFVTKYFELFYKFAYQNVNSI